MFQKFIIILTILLFNSSFAQDEKGTIFTDENIALLLKQRNDKCESFNIYTNFSIQIFSGEKENAEQILTNFQKNSHNIEATIIYNQPKFKVLVGNCRNKIEAENLLAEIKPTYPESFIVRLKAN